MSLPTEWSFSQQENQTGNIAQIVVPASGPTIRHVLTSFAARLTAVPPGGAVILEVYVFDGANLMFRKYMACSAPAAGVFNVDTLNEEGPIVGSPATALTVRFQNAAVVGIIEWVGAKGYDT